MGLEFSSGWEAVSEHPEVFKDIAGIVEGPALEGAEGITPKAEGTDTGLSGTPEDDKKYWHYHSRGFDTSPLCCAQSAGEALLGRELDQFDMIKTATENGWYDPELGPLSGLCAWMLRAMGLEVDRVNGHGDAFGGEDSDGYPDLSLDTLARRLNRGDKIICTVNSRLLENPRARLASFWPVKSVQVIGVDQTDPSDAKVILNDPDHSEGAGRVVSADAFLAAWGYRDRETIFVRQKGAQA